MTEDVKKAETTLWDDELSDESLDRATGARVPTVFCACRSGGDDA